MDQEETRIQPQGFSHKENAINSSATEQFGGTLHTIFPDPWHFGTDPDPDPRIRTSDYQIRIWIHLFRQWPSRRQQKKFSF